MLWVLLQFPNCIMFKIKTFPWDMILMFNVVLTNEGDIKEKRGKSLWGSERQTLHLNLLFVTTITCFFKCLLKLMNKAHCYTIVTT